MATTTPTTFAASLTAADGPSALARVEKHLAKVPGFEATGQVQLRSERHQLWAVEVANTGGDVNDCWVVLTSYGISPAPELGSRWEAVLGATAE